MNIAQLSEQLKDVPQPKLIDYARNPNSVVPQFLALAEIQRRQRLQVPQASPVRSTVADDVLQQANPVPQMQPQMMPQGVPSLPSGMGDQSFAGGGIVAFAEGGETDDEDELADRQRRARRVGITEKLNEMIAMLPAGIRNPLANLQNKPVASVRQAQADVAMEAPKKRGSHKYEDVVIEEAKRQGIDPNLALHVLYKETGNLSNPETARSRAGALGVMQLMPGTAKELGVNPLDPMENIRGGVAYLKKMYSKYEDPVLAAAAYNAGPGRVDRILKSGQGLTALPRETRGYIAGLAGGGIVAFAGDKGSKVEEDNPYLERSRGLYEGVRELGAAFTDPRNYDLLDMYQRYIGQPFARSAERFINEPLGEQAARFRRASMTPEATPTVGYTKPAGASTPVTARKDMPKQSDQADVRRVDNAIIAKQEEDKKAAQKPLEDVGPPVSLANVEAPKKTDYLELLAQDIERRAEAAKKAGDENKYLAILQAGLGMLGGTSPYALANIGAGGAKGVETYGALRKGQADEERAILAARLGLGKAQVAKEESEATREATKEYRDRMLGQKEDTAATAAQDRALVRIQKLDTDIEKAIRKEVEGNPMLAVNPNKEQIIETRIAQAKARHPLYGAYYKQAGLGEFVVPSLYSNIPQQAIDALKKNPKLQKEFDAKYGEGSAAKYLGK